MEEQTDKNQVQEQPVGPVPVSKKPNHWLIAAIILAVIVFLPVVFILFLNSQKSSPTPPSSISPTPSPATDETANWKTYKNKWISFKFPPSWQVEEVNTEFNKNIPNNATFFVMRVESPDYKDNGGHGQDFKMEGISLSVVGSNQHVYENDSTRTTPYKPIQSSEDYFYSYLPENARNQNFFLTDINGTKFVLHDKGDGGGMYVTGWDGSFYSYPYQFEFRITVPNERKDESKKVLEQILSTFKFLDQEDQVVCTLDAKVCPDGKTYVGREGPNCEFAKCP